MLEALNASPLAAAYLGQARSAIDVREVLHSIGASGDAVDHLQSALAWWLEPDNLTVVGVVVLGVVSLR